MSNMWVICRPGTQPDTLDPERQQRNCWSRDGRWDTLHEARVFTDVERRTINPDAEIPAEGVWCRVSLINNPVSPNDPDWEI